MNELTFLFGSAEADRSFAFDLIKLLLTIGVTFLLIFLISTLSNIVKEIMKK